MTGDGTLKTDTDTITVRTVWVPHGTGADITTRSGIRTGTHGDIVHGDITVTMTHGITEASTTHGTTEDGTADITEDGIIRGIIRDIGDGTTHGITTITIMAGTTLTIMARHTSEVHHTTATATTD